MNQDKLLTIAALGIFSIMSASFLLNYFQTNAQMASYPPTPAFSKIVINGTTYTAKSFNDKINLGNGFAVSNGVISSSEQNEFKTIKSNGAIITADNPEDVLTINTTGSLSAYVNGDSITIKINQISCPILQGIKGVDANGNLFCAAI